MAHLAKMSVHQSRTNLNVYNNDGEVMREKKEKK